ncbi:MAG TPA: Rne/Rng family ribonuclease [Terriglobales bacterium]|jgi:ribonuclease G
MTRELFVSSTPHETKVGLVEDDQLAEIYLELENEYTLAGSIYKGKVTRVLPGMQSAFVDIGLERDAFLYVSDFMDVEEGEDIEEVPTNRAPSPEAARVSQSQAPPRADHEPVTRTEGESFVIESPDFDEAKQTSDDTKPEQADAGIETSRESNGGNGGDSRGGFRGRRRRRGRRGERMPESKFARSGDLSRESPPRSERSSSRSDYGPPPGYQPILLPGESISKYQRLAQAKTSAPLKEAEATATPKPAPSLTSRFPEDEPLFATHEEVQETSSSGASAARVESEGETPSEHERDYQDEQLSHETVAAFDEAVDDSFSEDEHHEEPVQSTVAAAGHAGTLEEEEIEEDEADLSSYVEELDEDSAFEEMEEETHAADEYGANGAGYIATSSEPSDIVPSQEKAIVDSHDVDETEEIVEEATAEEDDEAAAEAEIEQAQAEAEAALEAEARGDGTIDARAEVRAPAATAGYTQRAARPSFDRRGGGRGRRGGKRFHRRREPQQLPQITDLLKEGQEILVQIAKEPIGKKGARITSHIALPGRFLVYMPTVNHTGVSRKIASEEERQRLKRIILSERENGHGGFIVRTAAQGANEEELRADIRFLKGLWTEIRTRAENGKAPSLIYHDLNVVERVLRDQVTSDFSAIWVDSEQEYERILRFANRFQSALVRRVKLYTKETPLFEQFGLKDEIDKALKSKVWLKSGGYIVINQTEALVAIDVNTGKYVGKTARLEDTIVKTNVDAIKEIVRQIRLRDLGGIIVIDFIDMDERRNRQKVMQALEEALRHDRAPSKVLQFNDFGLVAITRKRVKQSLERTIGSPCPYCQSTGFVKSVNTICNEIYVELRKVAKHIDSADVMLRVNPEVAKALKSNNGRALNEMEELTKKTVIVKSDPALHQEQFDVN